ncbi:sigma factor-like helix-turn-helix DNA-binding protein [Peribacillus sp. SCS-155]|uniref:sigma factor-like helix-turn-helix DNA-binding protein n=1 Tax=Peribacillus sedimenti TaxID=3115297 RepID=UPI003906CCBD
MKNLEAVDKNIKLDGSCDKQIWKELYPGLKRYCRFLSQNKWDGDEIAQEAVLKALLSYSHLPEINSALLHKIAYNHWIDTVRKRKHESVMEDIEQYKSCPRVVPDIHEIADYLLTQLTPKQAVILALKEGFQYRNKEIADYLKTTEMAVKSALHRAKQRLSDDNRKTASPILQRNLEEAETKAIAYLLHQSLRLQDPSVLIKAIPTLPTLKGNIKETSAIAKKSVVFIPKASASGPLCMAA